MVKLKNDYFKASDLLFCFTQKLRNGLLGRKQQEWNFA